MNWIDIAILSIIGLSALISFNSGFIKEAISLLVWITAFFIASTYYPLFIEQVGFFNKIADERLRNIAAIFSLFLLTIIVGSIFNAIFVRFIDATGMTGTNKILGFIFGALRGVFIVAAILFAIRAVWTDAPKSEWWVKSQLIPHFSIIDQWFLDNLQKQLQEMSIQNPTLQKMIPNIPREMPVSSAIEQAPEFEPVGS